jgi:hypothetical protein
MSKIEVDAVEPQSGTSLTLGASGDTITIPAGATLSNLGTASGFGLTWQSVQTTGFTAVKGNAYPCDTTSAAFTVTLPATPSAGDQVQLVDYAGTFDTNFLTIDPNGNKLESGTDNLILIGEREGVILTYIDSTQGWIATSGINEGTDALEPNSYSVDFLVIAGGGGGGSSATSDAGGAGGAGGYRNSYSTEASGGGGSSETSLTFTPATVYTITVGAGGSAGATSVQAGQGANSVISGSGITTITSIGGGFGGNGAGNGTASSTYIGGSGGSGGGGGYHDGAYGAGGSGTANQGFSGGTNTTQGGGGASASPTSRTGGVGLSSSITGSAVTRGVGGTAIVTGGAGTNGTANTGNGAGSGWNANGGAGGSGVVILRMPTARYSGTTTGSPTVTPDGTDTILTFNDSGSYTG